MADVTGLDRLGLPVYQAMRPASLNLSVSQGKGLSRTAARVSAVMESIEMWHAECLEHVPQVSVSLREMAYSNPISQDSLRWMTGTRTLNSLPISWVEARSMTGGRTGWLPRAMIELDFTMPPLFEPLMFVKSSSGLASGNTLEEALLHGLCEIVERHSWVLTQLEPGRLAAIDASSLGSEPLAEIIGAIRQAGMRLALYETTSEIGLPAAMAKLVAPDLPVVWHGFGCHTSPEIALSRALTEAAQSRLAYIAGARDDLVALSRGAVPHCEFEAFVEPAAGRRLDQLPDLSSDDLAIDFDRVVSRLADLGYEPYWVNLTRPEFGVPVVAAYVPGLREFNG